MKNVKISNVLAGLRAKTMNYCDLLCWLCEYGQDNWGFDLLLIKLQDYVSFHNSNDDEEDMKMEVVTSESIHDGAIKGIEIEEENFVSATINDTENEMILRLKDSNNKVKAYVLAVA